jgi:hypothetical protein
MKFLLNWHWSRLRSAMVLVVAAVFVLLGLAAWFLRSILLLGASVGKRVQCTPSGEPRRRAGPSSIVVNERLGASLLCDRSSNGPGRDRSTGGQISQGRTSAGIFQKRRCFIRNCLYFLKRLIGLRLFRMPTVFGTPLSAFLLRRTRGRAPYLKSFSSNTDHDAVALRCG